MGVPFAGLECACSRALSALLTHLSRLSYAGVPGLQNVSVKALPADIASGAALTASSARFSGVLVNS